MKHEKQLVCPRCKSLYKSEYWGQCLINNRIEFCCINCKDEFMYDSKLNLKVKINEKYRSK